MNEAKNNSACEGCGAEDGQLHSAACPVMKTQRSMLAQEHGSDVADALSTLTPAARRRFTEGAFVDRREPEPPPFEDEKVDPDEVKPGLPDLQTLNTMVENLLTLPEGDPNELEFCTLFDPPGSSNVVCRIWVDRTTKKVHVDGDLDASAKQLAKLIAAHFQSIIEGDRDGLGEDPRHVFAKSADEYLGKVFHEALSETLNEAAESEPEKVWPAGVQI